MRRCEPPPTLLNRDFDLAPGSVRNLFLRCYYRPQQLRGRVLLRGRCQPPGLAVAPAFAAAVVALAAAVADY